MAHDQIRERFRNAVVSAIAKVGETVAIDHAGLKGRFREAFVGDLLKLVTNKEYIIGSGLAVDHTGKNSPEADVIIFDPFHVPAVLYAENEGLFPIEGVTYYGEVKSRLTKVTLRDCVRKFQSVAALQPLPNAQNQLFLPPRFIFAWSSDLKEEGIQAELERYIAVDEKALSDPAATILCVVGKGYCYAITSGDGKCAWYSVGVSDGIQEVVNFLGGIANSLVDRRLQRFGTKFGHYIIPVGIPVKMQEVGDPVQHS
ncbi:DUF6602 domain-containing protein [Bradyrhizobium sp. USDA 3364]